jgi:N6-adenosine-specific RNA methylase IME4
MKAPAPFDNLQRGHYGTILIDAPTRFETYNHATKVVARGTESRPATVHYQTMTLEEIAALPIGDLAADNCVLFVWSCWPTIQQSFELIARWRFNYKTCAFSWMKADPCAPITVPRMGMGYWTRANTEHCLLATRGKPKRLHADVRQGIIELPREHSRKPACIHDRIERLVAGPYLELFARQSRAGRDSWGDQATKFDSEIAQQPLQARDLFDVCSTEEGNHHDENRYSV